MKRIFVITVLATIYCLCTHTLQAQSFLDKLNQKAKAKVNQRIDQKTDAALDKGLDDAENVLQSKGDSSSSKGSLAGDAGAAQAGGDAPQQGDSIKVYSNYDFVPGDTVLFEDHFAEDADGEFPSHWELKNGQAILNKKDDGLAFFLTDGNYCKVQPLMKSPSYLTGTFTIEYDYYANDSYPLQLWFFDQPDYYGDNNFSVKVERGTASYRSVSSDGLSGELPADIRDENFDKKWHHIAIAFKKQQLKIYVDQYRVLVVPRAQFVPVHFDIESIGDQVNPVIFKNFRVASGGGMNMLGKKFTDAKIITHGINFDIDKATLRPESMGTLNMIVQVLKDNPVIKFEVDGHTDNSGTPDHNLTLSRQRADAVRAQLVAMGIDAGRLTSKGYGDTKPISDNNTMEGKANNRRVEFVKQ